MPRSLAACCRAAWESLYPAPLLDLVVGLRDELIAAGGEWVDAVDARLDGRSSLPAVGVVGAVVSLARARVDALPLRNELRTTYWGEPPRAVGDELDELQVWARATLRLTDDEELTIAAQLITIAGSARSREQRDEDAPAESLWSLAKGVTDWDAAAGGALVARSEDAIRIGGEELLANLGVSFALQDTVAIEHMTEYALAFAQSTAGGYEEQIRQELLIGLRQGRTVNQVRDEIMQLKEGLWEFEAERIARTEIIRAHAEGQVAALRTLGVESRVWLTAEDERVCPLCGPRHLQVYAIDDATVSIPAHPYCRCAWGADEGELDVIIANLEGGRARPVNLIRNRGRPRAT